MSKYEVSHICAAVVAVAAIVGVMVASTLPKTDWANENHLTNWIIAVATFAGVFVSGFGLYWLRSTLLTNQEMVRVSRDALEDDIWLRSKERRPTLIPKAVTVCADGGLERIYFSVEMENIGSHQAEQLEYSYSIMVGTIAVILTAKEILEQEHTKDDVRNRFPATEVLRGGSSGSIVFSMDNNIEEGNFANYVTFTVFYKHHFARNQYETFRSSVFFFFRQEDLKIDYDGEDPAEGYSGLYKAEYTFSNRNLLVT